MSYDNNLKDTHVALPSSLPSLLPCRLHCRCSGQPLPTLDPQPPSLAFSPSFCPGVAPDELPEWLVFSSSSSKGRSGRPSSVSLVTSFVDVVRRGSSSKPAGESSSSAAPACPPDGPIASGGRCDGKAPMVEGSRDVSTMRSPPPRRRAARRLHGGCTSRGSV
jgi:hypothetical protein